MKEPHAVAFWAGIAAFFSTLLAVGIFDILDPAAMYHYLSAFIVALITAGSVYAKHRYDDAKKDTEK